LIEWQVYTSEEHGFQISYPPSYVIVPPLHQTEPPALLQLWFLDKVLAESETADMQVPQFTVNVYANNTAGFLNEWLAQNRTDRLDCGSFTTEPTTVGGVDGLRATSMLEMAPNVFIYVFEGGKIYEFIPLGEFQDLVLASVRFM